MKSAKLPAPLLSNEGTEFQSYWGPHLAFGSNWGHPSLFSSLEQVKKKRSPLFKWVPSHHSLLYCPSPRFFIFIIFYCFLSDMLGMPNYLCKSVFSWSTKSFIVFHPPPLFFKDFCPCVSMRSCPECHYSDFQLWFLSALTHLCEQTLLSQITASFPGFSSSDTDIGSIPRWAESKPYLNKTFMQNHRLMKKVLFFAPVHNHSSIPNNLTKILSFC